VKPALYYPWVYLKGGGERMLLELMTRSRHEWTLYTNRFERESTYPELAGQRVVELARISVRRSIKEVARAGITLLTQRLDLNNHDSLFVVSEGLGNLVALRSRIPTYCICLTPLKVAYDEVTRDRFFEARGHGAQYRLAISAYTQIDRLAWNRYLRVFCNSEEVRRRLLKARLVDDGRLQVAHHGVDIERFQPTGEREPYFLLPGRIVWTKNVELALRAWFEFKPSTTDNHFRLVIAGMLDAKSRPYLNQLRNLAGGRPDVEFVESPTDQELLRLYQACHAVIFTAPNEDWGLVPLEGMASGKPVLATDRGGPRESVVNNQTGFLVPDTAPAFAGAIHRLAGMPADDLDRIGAAARTRACEFRWDAFVDLMDRQVELATVTLGSRGRLVAASRSSSE